MSPHGHALGVDFGTSNSAAGYMQGDTVRLINLSPGQPTMPTTFFFDFDTRETLMGNPANQALLDGATGRFMRALKRVLGTPLMHEPRRILNERVTFVDIVAGFLGSIKSRAEADTGLSFERVLSGRPVVFHGGDDPREVKAEADLRACYLAAGFRDVAFLPEPEAVAIGSGALEQVGQIGLIVDIGGGTSDFSLFRAGKEDVTILSNHGVRIGGTDFDRAISIDMVMPLLGKGTQLKKEMGPGTTPVPAAIFNDLATWEKIPFLYSAQNRRMAGRMSQLAQNPEKLGRLEAVLEHELGHDIAFAVEKGKIATNDGAGRSMIDLGQVEPALDVPLSAHGLGQILEPHVRKLHTGATETLALAGLGADQVDRVIYVGGSSLMSMIPDAMRALFPQADHSFSDVFTAVAGGLARATSRFDRLA